MNADYTSIYFSQINGGEMVRTSTNKPLPRNGVLYKEPEALNNINTRFGVVARWNKTQLYKQK